MATHLELRYKALLSYIVRRTYKRARERGLVRASSNHQSHHYATAPFILFAADQRRSGDGQSGSCTPPADQRTILYTAAEETQKDILQTSCEAVLKQKSYIPLVLYHRHSASTLPRVRVVISGSTQKKDALATKPRVPETAGNR